MTDVRELDLTEVLERTGRNEVGPATGRGLRGVPGGSPPIVKALNRVRRRLQWRGILRLLLYCSPTLLAIGYYGLIASDRYVSTAAFVVRTASKPSGGTGLGVFLKMTGLGRSEDDTYSVQNFILSRDAVRKLQERMPLAEMYGRPGTDMLSRYPSIVYGSTNEELYKFYTKMTRATYSSATGVTTLEVEAFRPDDAHRIAVGILDLSEDLVNQLNARIQKDAVSAAEDQVNRDETRLTEAQVAITAFQNKETMIDPVNNSVMVSTLVAKLDADLAETQARIADMKAGSPNNPAMSALLRQADATRAQIDRERSRVTSSQEGLADKLGQYQRMVLEREFATKALSAANTALDTARAEVRRKQLYIERIVEPDLTDYATKPSRLWITFTVAMVNLLGLFLCWLLLSGVREHVSSGH